MSLTSEGRRTRGERELQLPSVGVQLEMASSVSSRERRLALPEPVEAGRAILQSVLVGARGVWWRAVRNASRGETIVGGSLWLEGVRSKKYDMKN